MRLCRHFRSNLDSCYWESSKRPGLYILALRRHNLPSKVRLRNNQTTRNVYKQSYFHVSDRRRILATLIWPRESLGSSCQSTEMATLLNSIYFVCKISFLHKYRVIYYDYTVKWCSLMNCNWCVWLDIV